MTQLAITLVPVAFGPDYTTDFGVSIHPLNKSAICGKWTYVATVDVENFHQHIHPYRHNVFLDAVEKDMTFAFDPNDLKPPFTAKLNVSASRNCTPGPRRIIVQAIGGDGRVRNSTYKLTVISLGTASKSNLQINSSERSYVLSLPGPTNTSERSYLIKLPQAEETQKISYRTII